MTIRKIYPRGSSVTIREHSKSAYASEGAGGHGKAYAGREGASICVQRERRSKNTYFNWTLSKYSHEKAPSH